MRATLDLSQVEQEELFELSELVALEIALEAERDLLENGIEREEFAEKGAAFLRDVPEDGEKGEGGGRGWTGLEREWKGSGKEHADGGEIGASLFSSQLRIRPF